eukprot:FN609364.1.p2 GENE.FN609364.1~~FN609364.1.p2  ORF type:complete len:68 (+),score=1.95 FN609364.1:23-226(+)
MLSAHSGASDVNTLLHFPPTPLYVLCESAQEMFTSLTPTPSPALPDVPSCRTRALENKVLCSISVQV